MPIHVFNCRMCHEEIIPNIVGGTEDQRAQAIGGSILEHVKVRHPKFLEKIAEVSTVFNGFLITNAFETTDEQALGHQEKVRVQLTELIGQYAPAPLALVKKEDENEDDDEDALRYIDCPECGKEVCIEELIADFEDGEDIEDEDEDDDSDDEKDIVDVKVVETTTEITEKSQRKRKRK